MALFIGPEVKVAHQRKIQRCFWNEKCKKILLFFDAWCIIPKKAETSAFLIVSDHHAPHEYSAMIKQSLPSSV
jgi:hypothetical protein